MRNNVSDFDKEITLIDTNVQPDISSPFKYEKEIVIANLSLIVFLILLSFCFRKSKKKKRKNQMIKYDSKMSRLLNRFLFKRSERDLKGKSTDSAKLTSNPIDYKKNTDNKKSSTLKFSESDVCSPFRTYRDLSYFENSELYKKTNGKSLADITSNPIAIYKLMDHATKLELEQNSNSKIDVKNVKY